MVLVLAMASAFAYRINPEAKPGPEPGVREFTAAELEAQQSQIVVLPDPTYVEDTGEKIEAPEVPAASGKSTTLDGGGESKPVDGAQVLRSVNSELKKGNSGLWRAALGFLVCSCVGFGGIAYVRNWAEKNAPNPAKMKGSSPRSAQKPKRF
jgi:hypothetical protein